MAADVSEAIVRFSSTGAYPDNEAIIAADLTPNVLNDVLSTLRQARAEVRKEVQALSKTTGSNVEQWISLAKQLQSDIQRSRDVARSIVEENQVVDELKEQVRDTASKIVLLEKEIKYEATLEDTLLRIGHANNILLQTQDAVVDRDVTEALRLLRTAREAVVALKDAASTKAVSILDVRGRQLKNTIEEAIAENWTQLVLVDIKQGRLEIREQSSRPGNTLQAIAKAAEDTGILSSLVEKLAKDIDRAITQKVLSTLGTSRHVAVLVRSPSTELTFTKDDGSGAQIAAFFSSLLDLFASQLPDPVKTAFVNKYIPVLANKLEEKWLTFAIPIDLASIPAFSSTVEQVERLVAQLEALDWPGASQLREWLDSTPKAWLTKQRETLLGNTRDIVFEKLNETKTVQRVEKQIIAADETEEQPSKTSGEDEWDNAWDEAEEHAPTAPSAKTVDVSAEEDDGSAWDVDDTEEPAAEGQADEDAWGWGDEANQEGSKGPPSPVQKHVVSQAPAKEKTQTMSETYTVTAIPDELFDMIEAVITNAQTLTKPEYAESPIAQAAAGLYSLPTLALAIYRATAPTAYAKLPAGNMMIYSDATRLAERLRAWQASQPPASRLRLDNDAKALEEFARRAYGAEMEAQRTIMRDLLDGAQGFSSCTTPPFKAACESAVEQAVDRLHEVNRLWQGILAPSALPQAVGQLLSTLTGKMIADIEDLSDISEPESQQLRALCDRVTTVKTLFMHGSADGQSDLTFVYCPNWLKFQYLAEILESSLADIRYLWTEGELSLEFEADAVVDLIKALFAESDKRRQAIAEIKRGARR